MTSPIHVVFWDADRGRDDRYDFARLGLPEETSRAFARAFEAITGGYRALGRKQAWRHLRRFARFLGREAMGVRDRLADPNLLIRYKEELLHSGVLRKTSLDHYNFARRLISWLIDNTEEGLWRSAILYRAPDMMSAESYLIRINAITPLQLRRITMECKREIAKIRRQLRVRERIEHGEHVPQTECDGISLHQLKELIALERQGIYSQRDLNRIHRGGLARRLRRAGPFRALTVRNAVPYYVLLLISTCGNPMGIKDIEIDCVRPHPTDPLKRRIVWDKYRAHQEQAYDTIGAGTYSPVRCIEDLLRLTAPIRKLAIPADTRKLMLTRHGNIAERISIQGMHKALREFRRAHGLPHFAFADLRRATAVAIDQFGKSGAAVRRVLQHRSPRTSRLYLQARSAIDRRYEGVLRFQGQMVSLARRTPNRPRSSRGKRPYQTVSGFSCSDPLSGIAPGSAKGHTCLQWLECCRCPNALVVRDDPGIVARIIRAAQTLNEMRAASCHSADATQHFDYAFRPTLQIIESEILPKVPAAVRARAQVLAMSLPALPLLE
jgi:hypothetical protein